MTPTPLPRYNVLGVVVSGVEPATAVERVLQSARAGAAFSASALAVHAVMEAQNNKDYRARLNTLDLAAPDGQPVRWALNGLHHTGLRQRVYGPFLMRSLCAAAAREDLPIFLFGTTGITLGRLTANLTAAHPGLFVAGTRPSRFRRVTPQEALEDARVITESGARLVFCGLGCPRQESWVHAMRPLVKAPLIGVGAAFALWASERPMAPAWMQVNGLEWLYRLGQEPQRLAGRYMVQGPGYFLRIVLQKFGRKPPSIDPVSVVPDYWG
jgi:N-acetylglucosaminyldiphosphoundecaprenol N-acetyl-beta-D-mannosaminyltransferase